MRILARWIELSLDVPIERPQPMRACIRKIATVDSGSVTPHPDRCHSRSVSSYKLCEATVNLSSMFMKLGTRIYPTFRL
jgi:hypothetical protein